MSSKARGVNGHVEKRAPAGAGGPQAAPGRARPKWKPARILFRNPLVSAGTIVILVVLVVAIFGPILSPYDPLKSALRRRLLGPSLVHPFGTDAFGRDVFTRIAYGARISLSLSLAVVLITSALAAALGISAAWYRRFDNAIMRAMDVMMSVPSLVLAITLMAFLGGSVTNLIIAIVLTQVPRSTRVVRSAALVIRDGEYVEAARAVGGNDRRIMFRHFLPNCLSPLVVTATFLFAQVILIESSLSFVGVGTPPPTPSWGNMLAEGREVMSIAWWLTVIPGLAIVVVVLGLNLIGDGLRDILDPRIKQ